MENLLSIIIMAAGKGIRMQSNIPKVLNKLAGETLLNHVINTAEKLNPQKIIVVVGYKAIEVRKSIKSKNILFSIQEEQKGTGHAIMQTEEHLLDFIGNTLILSGDVPLINYQTLLSFYQKHISSNFDASILTAMLKKPGGYGRIIRDSNENLNRILEHKDCNSKQLKIKEINSGIYAFNNKTLFKYLPYLDNNNAQSEYYLPDILSFLIDNNGKIGIKKIDDINEIQGVNTIRQLSELEEIYNKKIEI